MTINVLWSSCEVPFILVGVRVRMEGSSILTLLGSGHQKPA